VLPRWSPGVGRAVHESCRDSDVGVDGIFIDRTRAYSWLNERVELSRCNEGGRFCIACENYAQQ